FSLSSHFFFQAEDGIRDFHVTGVQTCALPISLKWKRSSPKHCKQADKSLTLLGMESTKELLLPGGYCRSKNTYSRFKTRVVNIGDIPMGGDFPIRIQSMTTVATMDTIGSVEQTIRMVDAGCEYVRITAPSIKEAENLALINKELRQRGYHVPLVADIHFTPNAAEVAARIVEKVRVNPGNYADKKKFDQIDYTDAAYRSELERIYKKFAPLVGICKEYGTAMRIGTNHGSLSDRIMSRYGDTPEGMVESAMEFIRICEDLNYYNLVVSMKSSNPQVMVQAYRLLVERMIAEHMNYPLHLGVTEAGDGEDGRIKSAVGIGTLLEDGLGDTIRVSLTEEPEYEAPVAIALANRYKNRQREAAQDHPILVFSEDTQTTPYISHEVNTFVGGSLVPRVIVDISAANLKDPFILSDAGYKYDAINDKYHMGDQSVDFVYLADKLPSFTMPGNLKQLYDYPTWLHLAEKTNIHPLYQLAEFNQATVKDPVLNMIRISNDLLQSGDFQVLQNVPVIVFVLEADHQHGMADQRQFFANIQAIGLDNPVIIKRTYIVDDFSGPIGKIMEPEEPVSKLQIYAATDVGALLIDGLGSGTWIDAPAIAMDKITSLSFGILQATRSRISKTEYISCQSCGR